MRLRFRGRPRVVLRFVGPLRRCVEVAQKLLGKGKIRRNERGTFMPSSPPTQGRRGRLVNCSAVFARIYDNLVCPAPSRPGVRRGTSLARSGSHPCHHVLSHLGGEAAEARGL